MSFEFFVAAPEDRKRKKEIEKKNEKKKKKKKKKKTRLHNPTHRISHLAHATYASTVGRALTYRS